MFKRIAFLAAFLAALVISSPSAQAVNLHFDGSGVVLSVTPEYTPPGSMNLTRVVISFQDTSTGYVWAAACRRAATLSTCANLHQMQIISISGDITRPCSYSWDTSCGELSVITVQ